jgi:pimeloyl-ACP methyl ester carboxylesterase
MRSAKVFNQAACAIVMMFSFFTTAQALNDPIDPLPRQNNKPFENITGVDTYYGSVQVEPGVRLRTLISRPKNIDKPLHPFLFTQWVSCGSIELKEGAGGKLGMLARESGLALVRVDRSGAGDSQGPSCDNLDYDTEVEHYVSAFAQMLKDKRIDASKVYVMGESLGSTTAPLVADRLQGMGYNIEAVVVQGGGALTHLERMINFDRFYLERRPNAVSRTQIHEQMNHRIIFQTEYLLKGRHPDEVAKDSPMMMAVRNDVRGLEKDNHYGRPFAWHQQAAKQNFLAAWESLNARVLVIFNQFDQFETRHGHELIVDTVNRKSSGSADLVVQKGLGHSSWSFNSLEDAYAYEAGVSETKVTGKAILDWLTLIRKP